MKPEGFKLFSALCLVAALSFSVLAFPASLPDAFADEGTTHEMYYYIVRQGDCLWNLSQEFYNDEWKWPLVWGNNGYIANPNWIYPGDTIYLAYANKNAPEPSAAVVTEKPVSSSLTTLRVPRDLADTALLSEEGVKGAGWVLASEDGRALMAKGDQVFLEVSPSQEGGDSSVYQVLHRVRKIRHPLTGKDMGTLFRMMGSVEVVSRTDTSAARAKVLTSQGTIEAGDLLYAGATPEEEVYSKRAKRKLEGNIVAGLRPKDTITQHEVCFIDKGVLDGVEVGDSFWVLEKGRQVKGYGEGGKATIPDTRVALLVVIHAEKTASTALVTDSRKEFPVGAPVKSWTE